MYHQAQSAAKNEENYCCDVKKQLINNYKLFETLVVCPKFVTFQKFGAPYSAKVTITNTFHKIRTLDITTNFPDYLSYKVFESELNLIPDISTTMIIYLHANKRSLKENERFSIFLHSKHPDMTMEIPVFLLTEKSDANVCYPKFIKMPDTSPRIRSYYAFPIYNYFKNGVCYKLSLLNAISKKNFNFNSSCNFIIPKDCSMVYLDAYSENYCTVKADLIIRFGDGIKSKYYMHVSCEMKEYMLHCSAIIIRFQETTLGLSAKEYVQLCNESDIKVKYKWCNHITKAESKNANESFNNNNEKIFQVEPISGSLEPYTSEKIKFTFLPLKKIPEDITLYPYQFKTTAYLDCSTNWKTRNFIDLHGIGVGPNIEINPLAINLHNIFIGNIVAKIKFDKFVTILKSATCIVHPDELHLEPKESRIFQIDYYTSSLGSFLDEVVFQIECGEKRTVIIKGTSIPFELNIKPEVLEIGTIPMCILQKCYLKITNPISSPIIVKLGTTDDGTSPPLFLNITEMQKLKTDLLDLVSITSDHIRSEDSNNVDYLSSTVSTESNFDYWIYTSKWDMSTKSSEGAIFENARRQFVSFNLANSTIPIENPNDKEFCEDTLSTCEEYEAHFPDKVLDESISIMVTNVLKFLKSLHDVEENASEKISQNDIKLIENIFNELKATEQFRCYLKSWDKFIDINWNNLPNFPKECMIDKRPIYFGPNETKKILICLIPNICGNFTKNIEAYSMPCCLDNNIQNIPNEINSINMTTNIQLTYSCLYPKLHLQAKKIRLYGYVDKPVYFKLTLQNVSDIMGFVMFKIQPCTREGRIHLLPHKFLIAAKGRKIIHCKADLFLPGNYCINGCITIIGTSIDIPYKILISAKPPNFHVKPKFITNKQEVLTNYVYKLFIHNSSPTFGRFHILFKRQTNYLDCYPKGGILGPGQAVVILINVYYYDPDIYDDALQIYVTHIGCINVPLKFTITGIPIQSIPNLKNDVNFGYFFITKQLNPYKNLIQFINYGEREYILSLKKKTTIPEDKINTLLLHIESKLLVILPNSITTTNLLMSSLTPIKLNDNFIINCAYNISQRCTLYKFNVLAEFIKPKVKWNINKIDFTINHTEFTNTNKSSELVQLINTTKIPINVKLSASNQYSMILLEKCIIKRENTKKLQLMIKPEGIVDIIVLFEENTVKVQTNRIVQYKGHITTTAESYKQRSLHMVTTISHPHLKICIPTQFYFSNGIKFVGNFNIANPGKVITHFEWNFLKESIIQSVYVETDKMRSQKDISEAILSRTIQNLLTEPIDIDEEYMTSLEKWEKFTMEEDDDVYCEKSTLQKIESLETHTTKKSTSTYSNETSVSTKLTEYDDFQQIYDEIQYYLDITEPVKKLSIYDTLISFSTTSTCYTIASKESQLIDNDEKIVLLDHYEGSLKAGESLQNYFYFNCNSNVQAISATFDLKLVGGESDELAVVIYNTTGRIELSETNIDLGVQPWYKEFNVKLRLINRNYNIYIINIVLPQLKLVDGYIKNMKSHNLIYLSKYPKSIRFNIFSGLHEYFNESFGVGVNDTVPVLVNFKCNSKIPWISVLGVQRPNLFKFNPIVQYETLNYIWKNYIIYIEIPNCSPTIDETKEFLIYLSNFQDDYLLENPNNSFNKNSLNKNVSLTEFNEIVLQEIAEANIDCLYEQTNNKHYSILPDNGIIYKTFYSKPKFAANLMQEYDKDLIDFIVLDYSPKYPNALELEMIMEKNLFIKNISENRMIKIHFQKTVRKYITLYEKPSCGIYYKTFIVRPLAHLITEYEYDLGEIILNRKNIYNLSLVFHGPGKCILSARTQIIMPGFEVIFDYPKQDIDLDILDSEFSIYTTPHNITDPVPEQYQNRFERESSSLNYMDEICCANCRMCGKICKNCQVKVCHPHSFDLSKTSLVHRRDMLLNRKQINDKYTQLNQSFKERKDPLILCELFQKEGAMITDELLLNLKIIFTPSTKFFKKRNTFDDYLMIDIHLGPTIPILLNGQFVSPNENSSSSSTFEFSNSSNQTDYEISRSL